MVKPTLALRATAGVGEADVAPTWALPTGSVSNQSSPPAGFEDSYMELLTQQFGDDIDAVRQSAGFQVMNATYSRFAASAASQQKCCNAVQHP